MGSGVQASRSFEIQKAWPDAICVYPTGVPTRSHYDSSGRFNGWSTEVKGANRDIEFFDALYARILQDFGGDPNRVFVMGHSNGAGFAYTLWATRANRLAGIGCFEGALPARATLSPKPFFISIGDQDALVPPSLQHRCLNKVFQVNGSSAKSSPFGEKGELFAGKEPVVLWPYHGGHRFPAEAVPSLGRFFQGIR